MPFSDQGPQPFVIRLYPEFRSLSRFFADLDESSEPPGKSFRLYIINLISLHEAGIDLRFPHLFSAIKQNPTAWVADRWGRIADQFFALLDVGRLRFSPSSRPNDWQYEIR